MVACLSIKYEDLVDALYCVQVCTFSLTGIKGWCVGYLAGYHSTSLGRLKKEDCYGFATGLNLTPRDLVSSPTFPKTKETLLLMPGVNYQLDRI